MPEAIPADHPFIPLRLSNAKIVDDASAFEPDQSGVAHLTRRLAAGNEEAFREFHALYFDRLYQFLLAVTRGREHEAQEAVQETLLRVVRYVRTFETEDTFWCWLKAVSRNAARDGGRKHRRYFAMLQNFALRRRNHLREQAAADENRLQYLLEESLDELDAQDRQLLEGKYIDGATVGELSAQTGLTDRAVESRLLRLRNHLRERLLKKLQTP